MAATVQAELTIGGIARRLGTPIHRIEYLINSRKIAPKGRAGQIRLFTEADLAFIKSELARIDSDREGVAQ